MTFVAVAVTVPGASGQLDVRGRIVKVVPAVKVVGDFDPCFFTVVVAGLDGGEPQHLIGEVGQNQTQPELAVLVIGERIVIGGPNDGVVRDFGGPSAKLLGRDRFDLVWNCYLDGVGRAAGTTVWNGQARCAAPVSFQAVRVGRYVSCRRYGSQGEQSRCGSEHSEGGTSHTSSSSSMRKARFVWA